MAPSHPCFSAPQLEGTRNCGFRGHPCSRRLPGRRISQGNPSAGSLRVSLNCLFRDFDLAVGGWFELCSLKWRESMRIKFDGQGRFARIQKISESIASLEFIDRLGWLPSESTTMIVVDRSQLTRTVKSGVINHPMS